MSTCMCTYACVHACVHVCIHACRYVCKYIYVWNWKALHDTFLSCPSCCWRSVKWMSRSLSRMENITSVTTTERQPVVRASTLATLRRSWLSHARRTTSWRQSPRPSRTTGSAAKNWTGSEITYGMRVTDTVAGNLLLLRA